MKALKAKESQQNSLSDKVKKNFSRPYTFKLCSWNSNYYLKLGYKLRIGESISVVDAENS